SSDLAQDLTRFVADDAACLLVPEHRHQHLPGVLGVGGGIDLMQVLEAVQVVRQRLAEAPALRHDRLDHRHRDRVLQPFERARDQRSMRPGAGQRHVQVVAARFGAVAAGAVRGNAVPKLRAGAHELARGFARVVPTLVPLAVLEVPAHDNLRFAATGSELSNLPPWRGSYNEFRLSYTRRAAWPCSQNAVGTSMPGAGSSDA